jgi:hypothetical protein
VNTGNPGVYVTDIIKFEIHNNYEACKRFNMLLLSDTPEGHKLIECSLRGSSGGLGSLIHYFLSEAKDILIQFLNSEVERQS